MRLLDDLLVRSPKGWDESGVAGSVRYERADLHTFSEQTDEPKALLLFAGRCWRSSDCPYCCKRWQSWLALTGAWDVRIRRSICWCAAVPPGNGRENIHTPQPDVSA